VGGRDRFEILALCGPTIKSQKKVGKKQGPCNIAEKYVRGQIKRYGCGKERVPFIRTELATVLFDKKKQGERY